MKLSAGRELLVYPELITLALLLAALAVALPSPYMDVPYLLDSTSLEMEVGIMALAMTFVIASGNIDLSVASNLALTSVLCARLYTAGLPMPLAAAAAPVIGALLGLFNGVAVARLRLPSLAVTLGTLALYRGVAHGLVGEHAIGGFPEWFLGVDYRYAGPLPLPLIIFLLLAAAAGLALHCSVFGRQVFVIGTSEPAARFSGIPVERTKLLVFVISGAAAGIGAAIMLSRLGSAEYDRAKDEELAVITAVVLGGTSIFGGRGSILGTVLALFLLVIIRRAMGLAEVSAEKQLALIGALLIAAVLLARVGERLAAIRPKGADLA